MPITRRDILRAGAATPIALAVPSLAYQPWPEGTVRWSREVDDAFHELVGRYHDPAGDSVAALGAVWRPGLDWRGATGYADRATRRRARRGIDYRFRVGSVSKTFTATVVLQLVQERRVRLEDPIARWLPGLVPGDDRIVVRHLLNLTSGLPDFIPLLFPSMGGPRPSYQEFHAVTSRPITPASLVGQAAAGGLSFEPGSQFEYSTTNYLVLGLLVERATGRRLRDELYSRVIRPLRLRHTDLPDTPGLPEPFLHGYGHFNDRPETWADISARYEHGWAGGGIVSNIEDLTRFFSTLLCGELLSEELMAAMMTPSGAPTAGRLPPGAPAGGTYGLGLLRDDRPACGPMWGHGGDTHGYNTRVVMTPDARAGVIVVKTGFPTPAPEPDNGFQLFIEAAFATVCA